MSNFGAGGELIDEYNSITSLKVSSIKPGDVVYIKYARSLGGQNIIELIPYTVVIKRFCKAGSTCKHTCFTNRMYIEGYGDRSTQILCKFRLHNKLGKKYE